MPMMSNLFEKVLTFKLRGILLFQNRNLAHRRTHSTIEQTRRLVETIRKKLGKNIVLCLLSIEVSQAFNDVWHEDLMHKLITNLLHNIVELLKSNRTGCQLIINV